MTSRCVCTFGRHCSLPWSTARGQVWIGQFHAACIDFTTHPAGVCEIEYIMMTFLSLLKKTVYSWDAHNAPQMGAALAYYMILSLAPLVILLVGITGLVVEQDAARTEIVAKASALMGQEGAATVQAILSHSAGQQGGLLATIIGFVVLLIGASGVFAELQDSLNRIWEVETSGGLWLRLFRKRILSFAMVFGLGALVLASLLLSAAMAALSAFVNGWVSGLDGVWENANYVVLFILVTLLFAALFRFLPDVRVDWRDVWTGSAITGLLFIFGKFLLSFYIRQSAFASAYGAAGSIVILLLWVFYSAQIFFFGAEFTHAYAQLKGSHRKSLEQGQDSI